MCFSLHAVSSSEEIQPLSYNQLLLCHKRLPAQTVCLWQSHHLNQPQSQLSSDVLPNTSHSHFPSVLSCHSLYSSNGSFTAFPRLPSSLYPLVSSTICPASPLDKRWVLLLETAWDRCRLQFQLLLSAERQRLCRSAALKPLHQTGPKVNRAVRPSSKLLNSCLPHER